MTYFKFWMAMEIKNDLDAGLIFADVDGLRAFIKYTLDGNVMDILSTQVPSKIGGRGVAAELTKFALDLARKNNWEVRPTCGYTKAYLKRYGR
ncbi:conserved hypothetical protein [Taylorella asinigenitalis 14/45]|uniref:N-acetyltransferase domain-containing protein n=2 Tax=Taylorella asinigenitalis TaxID=84590 RepID=I7JLV8_9BURK|nr:conserved hypothetical protein [Taylorella asinigenitalis 14/45]